MPSPKLKLNKLSESRYVVHLLPHVSKEPDLGFGGQNNKMDCFLSCGRQASIVSAMSMDAKIRVWSIFLGGTDSTNVTACGKRFQSNTTVHANCFIFYTGSLGSMQRPFRYELG